MGNSDPTNKPWTFDKIIELGPNSVLDVGAGLGVYGRFIRDKMSVERLDAIEAWKPSVEKFRLRDVYDKVFVEDARNHLDWKYDLVIFGDVLEHMSEVEALSIWKMTSAQAKYAIISIPIIHYPQHDIEGNPYEVHVDEDWTTERVLNTFEGIIEHVEFPVTGVFIAKFSVD